MLFVIILLPLIIVITFIAAFSAGNNAAEDLPVPVGILANNRFRRRIAV